MVIGSSFHQDQLTDILKTLQSDLSQPPLTSSPPCYSSPHCFHLLLLLVAPCPCSIPLLLLTASPHPQLLFPLLLFIGNAPQPHLLLLLTLLLPFVFLTHPSSPTCSSPPLPILLLAPCSSYFISLHIINAPHCSDSLNCKKNPKKLNKS